MGKRKKGIDTFWLGTEGELNTLLLKYVFFFPDAHGTLHNSSKNKCTAFRLSNRSNYQWMQRWMGAQRVGKTWIGNTRLYTLMRVSRASYFTHVETQGGALTCRTLKRGIGRAKISKRSLLFCPQNCLPSLDATQKKTVKCWASLFASLASCFTYLSSLNML